MKDSETLVQRDEHGRLLPGSILNPVGMRQGTRHFSTLFTEAVKKIADGEEETDDILMVRKVVAKAKEGDLKAFDIVREEVDGLMPKAAEGSAGTTFNIVVMNFDEYSNPKQSEAGQA